MKVIVLIVVGSVLAGLVLGSHAAIAMDGGNIGVIVVDVQGGFTTWKEGSLAVPGSDEA